MNELRRILRNQLRALVGLAALGCLVHLQVAQAQEVADPAFNRFRSQVVGNSVNFSYGSGGTTLGGAGNATGIGVTSGIDVGRSTSINTKHGPVTGTLTQKISNAAMGKAFGRAAAVIGGPVGLAFLALPAIIDWMGDAGVRPNPSGTGWQGADPAACTVAPCFEYRSTSVSPSFTTDWSRSPPTVQAQHVALINAAQGVQSCADGGGFQNWVVYSAGAITGTTSFVLVRSSQTCANGVPSGSPSITNSTVTFGSRSASPVTDPYVDITIPQLEERMSIDTSPEALAELYKLGANPNFSAAHPIPDLVDTLRAEFEARSPESTETTTTDSPAETKTEERTCATYTQVVGSTLSLVEECETTTTTQPKDPVTGLPVGDPTTTTTNTSNTTPDPATNEEQANEDPCLTSPNRVACIELGTPEGEIPTSTRSVEYQEESVFGGGTCPADKYVEVRGQQLRITDMAKTCDMLEDYAKPIALLLAAFSALMIVAVGMPE